MTTRENQISVDESTRKAALNRRLEGFGWGALLIVIGTIWLLPESQVPHGSWLIAAGLILLGLNAVRCINGIAMRGFSLIAGFIALTMGLGEFFGLKLPLFAIVLIMVGAGILLKMMLEKDSASISPAGRGWSCCGGMMQDTSSQNRVGQPVGRS
ncbi:MAG TPA: hypothetical protein VFJ47_08815 [Terriglobales bacterium]|nr:hypothetical protein [Terriglobales bacterium]